MHVEPARVPAQAISRLVERSAPVLIFEVDASAADAAQAPASRCEVRLIGSVRGQHNDEAGGGTPELSAVLLLHASTPSRLLSCVRAVTRGASAPLSEPIDDLLDAGSARGSAHQLSSREFDVLRLLADGGTTREIADQLSYSERTVKNIVHDLLAKLNCRTRAHAVALAARQGMV